MTEGARTEYVYKDAKGREVYKKVKVKDRQGNKKFWIEKKTENGWQLSKGDFDPIPYRLDEFKNHEKVLVVEGERDANSISDLNTNTLATSAPTGKGNWDDRLTPFFRHFKEVIFVYDVGAEENAKNHAETLKKAYPEMDVFLAKVPLEEEKKDITDYLEQEENPVEALQSVLEKRERIEIRQETIEIPIRRIQRVPELLINNSFLNLWVDTLSRITDAPRIFLTFSGIALLSGFLNKFYFKWPRRIHLNLYILLLALSHYFRKSTCTQFVSDYLEECNPNLGMPELFTVEGLYKRLAEEDRPKKLVIWPELMQLKELQMGKEYNRGSAAFLTDIYDYKKRWRKWTVGDGEIIVEEPVISILTAGITDWFTKNLNPIDFHGGLWTRFLFIPAPEMERSYTLPRPFTLNPAIVRRLNTLDDLESREVNLSRILPMMEEWGTRHQEETMRLGTEILSAMFQRLETMLLKLAAIFQISHDQTTVITPESFEEAVKVIEYLKAQLPPFFNEEIRFGEFDKAVGTILRFIKRKGRVMKKAILQSTKLPAKKLADPALLQLIEEGEIRMTEVIPTERGGRPGKMYEYIGEER